MRFAYYKEIFTAFLIVTTWVKKCNASSAYEEESSCYLTPRSLNLIPAEKTPAALPVDLKAKTRNHHTETLATPPTLARRDRLVLEDLSLAHAVEEDPKPYAARTIEYYEAYLNKKITHKTLPDILKNICDVSDQGHSKSEADLFMLGAIVYGCDAFSSGQRSHLSDQIEALRQHYWIILPSRGKKEEYLSPDEAINLGPIQKTICSIKRNLWVGHCGMLFSRSKAADAEPIPMWTMMGLVFFIPRSHDPENSLRSVAINGFIRP
ncbi:MAG: hypothetical protein H6849_01135 [Alphaproteobacteria bacterium]|nr:MAG: hypothetical protein H6849_01135 [Alphaproteobacteria bacterium]